MCLKVRISGIDTIVEPITLATYTAIGFKSIAIPIGIAPLSSVNGSMAKSIISKYLKESLHIKSNPDLFYNIWFYPNYQRLPIGIYYYNI